MPLLVLLPVSVLVAVNLSRRSCLCIRVRVRVRVCARALCLFPPVFLALVGVITPCFTLLAVTRRGLFVWFGLFCLSLGGWLCVWSGWSQKPSSSRLAGFYRVVVWSCLGWQDCRFRSGNVPREHDRVGASGSTTAIFSILVGSYNKPGWPNYFASKFVHRQSLQPGQIRKQPVVHLAVNQGYLDYF